MPIHGGFEGIRLPMTNPNRVVQPMHDPGAQLERALVEAFIRSRGHDPGALDALPADERKRLLSEASVYAAGRLAELEARSRFVHQIQEIHSEE